MRNWYAAVLVAGTFGLTLGSPAAVGTEHKIRIAVVSSYHAEYLWSQDTNAGVVAAMQDLGYLDGAEQGDVYSRTGQVESTRAIVRKLWLDSKRRSHLHEIKESVARVVRSLDVFRPDLILLGDDNATNYLGNHYIDSDVPVVFWGVNGSPMKYRLLDSVQRPGHNVTGIYQAGYLREGVESLLRLVPDIRTVGVLSDASPTGRSKVKGLHRLARQGALSASLVDVVVTNDYDAWREGALALSKRVDAFVVLNHNTLKHADGRSVDQLEAGRWYLQNIRKPDVSHEKQFVIEGVLLAVDDSGFKQGYEAMRVADRILRGESPAAIPAYAPSPGGVVVNLERAAMLDLLERVGDCEWIDERIEQALALN